MRKCDSCGKLYQENKDVFCPHCGAVAQKQCTHKSSFDSNRYDRGEIYKSNNSQYQNTTYNQSFEPHAQRESAPYNSQKKGDYDNKIPQINIPDLKTVLSKGKNLKGKPIGIIIFICIITFNMLFPFLDANEVANDTGLWEDVSEIYVDENIDQLYAIVDKATIEIVDMDEEVKTFTLEIHGMGFDAYLSENMQNDISSGTMVEQILSENTFVEMLVCDFKKEVVSEESYNNAVNDSYYFTGEQIDGRCKYEFTYSFDYDEIVHIASGVNFYLDDGMYINAELPFSAFSVS